MNKKTNTHRLLYKLFTALAHTLDDIGYANTISVLNNSRQNKLGNYEKFNDCVKSVMSVFEISRSELLNGTQKKYPRKYAFGILIYISTTNLGYSVAEIGRQLNRDRSYLSRIKNEMERKLLSPKNDNKFDLMILTKYNLCKEKMELLKKEQLD